MKYFIGFIFAVCIVFASNNLQAQECCQARPVRTVACKTMKVARTTLRNAACLTKATATAPIRMAKKIGEVKPVRSSLKRVASRFRCCCCN